MPSALANRPEPTRYAAPYLSAFKRLHSARIIGPNGHPSGIAITEIKAYARMFGFDSLEDRFDLMHFVKVCDDAWMQQAEKRRPKENGAAGKHVKGRR